MPTSRSLSVLIVEDYPDSAESMAELVELYGHSARSARAGKEALRLAQESAPDVVILDVGLLGADGFAVSKMLCEMLERRPLLIVVTGFQDTAELSRNAGIDHHYTKPIEPGVLERLLAQHAARVEPVTMN